jgi:acyl-CoA thioester hydrolase
MPKVFEYRHTVRPEEIDGVGHVNNVAYLEWLQSAAIQHSRAQGWPPEAYVELGAGWVVRAHRIEYLRPAFLGDQIVVRTWVATMARASSQRRYEVVRPADSALLAKAETDWVFINYTTRLPIRVPIEIASAFEIHSH